MAALSAKAVALLAEQKFDDPEQALAALAAGLANSRQTPAGPKAASSRRTRAKLLLRLAESYLDRREGGRAENIEMALAACNNALETVIKEDAPLLWAQVQHRLGGIHLGRLLGTRSDNLERAITHYENALAVRAREDSPVDFAKTQNNLAVAYRQRVCGDRAENLERATDAYEAALAAFAHAGLTADWAKAQNNLAIAYRHRIRGERGDNLERAISHFNAALTVLTRDSFPTDWAMTQHNLASTYSDRIEGNRVDNLELAIPAYEASLTVRTREALPAEWARTQNNLAIAYSHRVRGERADNLERAITSCEMALTVWTRECAPEDWAEAQNNLAIAYRHRIRGERAENLERAIAAYEAALLVHTRDGFPEEWAQAQNNLAIAYRHRVRGKRADNLERAIAHYQAALSVYSHKTFPTEWARTQNNLGAALADRTLGDRADNLEQALAAYEAALTVRARDAVPIDWAQTQHNLAIACSRRVRGERADNLERAIAAYEAALTIRTRQALPRSHLETCEGLGRALLAQRAWRAAANTLLEARETFLLLLSQGIDEAEAQGLIEAAGSLFAGAAYAAAELGEPNQAFRLACEGRARLIAAALRLETLDLAPDQRRHLEGLRSEIKEQSLLLERVTGLERTGVLDRIRQLYADLSSIVTAAGDGWSKSDPLAQAAPLVARGCVIAAPVVTEVGAKLLLVTGGDQAAPKTTTIDLPELTAERLRNLIRGQEEGSLRGWLAAFAPDVPWRERKARSADAVEEMSRELWSLLGCPLECALRDHKIPPGTRVIFMPSGALGLLPLGLARDPATGRHFVEALEIVNAPCISALAMTPHETERPAACSLAAAVNPTVDLMFAEVEGAFVAAHFEPQSCTVLDHTIATPDAVLAAMRGKTHWHFSTHGIFDFEEARRSALAMKDGAPLSVGSLLSARGLGRPRLVTLSACETGLHEIDRIPEEFIGLTGALITLGARAVLSTLWPVDDRATALLMAKFYDGHLDEGLAPAAALRKAQLWIKSATRKELVGYVLAAENRNRIGANHTRKLVRALMRASGEAVRFFSLEAESQASGDKSADTPLQDRETAIRPFAHPVYWGGFVVTGL